MKLSKSETLLIQILIIMVVIADWVFRFSFADDEFDSDS